MIDEIKFHNVTPELLKTIVAAIEDKHPKARGAQLGQFIKVAFLTKLKYELVGTDLVVTLDIPEGYVEEGRERVHALIDPLVPAECR